MIIALFPHEKIKKSFEIAKEIQQFLSKNKITVVAEDEYAKEIGAKPISTINDNDIQFLISMGGDGTILRLSHKYKHLDAAIVGINLGFLGFMADIPLNDIKSSLQDLIDGSYMIDNRLMLKAKAPGKDIHYASNDMVLHRGENHSLIELKVSVDGSYLNTFSCDGLIIATPNGSTAYSLAAGGPILNPELEAFVITPICPHTISNRPFVLSSDHKIEIEYLADSHQKPIVVYADGIDHFSMNDKDSYTFSKSTKKFKLVKLKRHDYFSTLRTKLNWSGKLSI